MTASDIERLQQELAAERAARERAEVRTKDTEEELDRARQELEVRTEELQRNVAQLQEMALRHQQALVRLAGLSPDGQELSAVRREITKVAAATIGVERASVWLLSPDGQELCCEELYEFGPNRYSQGTVLRATDYPRYFAALKLGRAIDGHDARRDPRTSEFTEGYLEPLGITSMLDAAIRHNGEVAGVVCLEHVGEPRTWTPAEMEFAAALADQVALALAAVERRRLEGERERVSIELQRARQLTLVDELTGLANRRALDGILPEEVSRALRHRHPLSILMVDIDHFKKVNDDYGHPAGDEVLRQMAQLLTQGLRSIDKGVRYGGEELLVVLPETDASEAYRVAERFRRSVEEHAFVVDPEDDDPPISLRLTASVGVAGLPENADSLQRLVEVADRALYDAKRQGRNRVVAACAMPQGAVADPSN